METWGNRNEMMPNAKIYSPPKQESHLESSASDVSTSPVNVQSQACGFVIPFSTQGTTNSLPEKKNHIAYQSRQMNELIRLATRYADSSASVMITGESGTGKELFSRLLHDKSSRADQKFIAFNCAAVPESLIESEIFGHERGAFTGAVQRRIGYFEKADQGTLLLDEISEIPATLQAKLLRVLEEQEVQPIGADRPRPIDVRIVATSNRDLKTEVANGNFREDLFHRLNVLDLRIPPLRERVTDIPLLVLHFVEMFRNESGHQVVNVTKEAMQSLCSHQWPGNVRELRNVIHRACVVANTSEICLDSLPKFESTCCDSGYETPTEHQVFNSLAGLTLAEVERRLILMCLQKFDGNKTSAAAQLGVTARTLSNKLKLYRENGLPCS
jgi:DNA-binding NtrC family response regulator